jgi:hypothetical protein
MVICAVAAVLFMAGLKGAGYEPENPADRAPLAVQDRPISEPVDHRGLPNLGVYPVKKEAR